MRTDTSISSETVGVGVEGLSITYRQGRRAIRALDRISVEVKQGELLVLLGPSGCGQEYPSQRRRRTSQTGRGTNHDRGPRGV